MGKLRNKSRRKGRRKGFFWSSTTVLNCLECVYDTVKVPLCSPSTVINDELWVEMGSNLIICQFTPPPINYFVSVNSRSFVGVVPLAILRKLVKEHFPIKSSKRREGIEKLQIR